MSMCFYFPGKMGDAIHQFPIVHWWHKETGKPYQCWIDEPSCKPLKPLLEAQPGCALVNFTNSSENYTCGGQPWHGNFNTKDFKDDTIISLGFRSFPQRQITIETRQKVPVSLKVKVDDLSETPCFVVPDAPKANRCLIHAMGVCTHNRQTPDVWKFLAQVRANLEERFDVIEFIGTDEEREIGVREYGWGEFSDGGDFLALATHMNASRFVIGCGSSPVALAGALKVPSIRVHDPIGQIPKVIFSNLGKGQLNATELELRKLWPEYAATYLNEETNVTTD